MGEAYHRALMAFPDEDVVVGARFVAPGAVDAFKELDDVTPTPGVRAVGEERAWGRRLAKRFDVEGAYDEQTFVVKPNGQEGFIDHEVLKPEAVDPGRQELFAAGAGRRRRVADRLRLDDGRGPRQARRPLVSVGAAVPEFADVVRRRRMTRAFDGRPVPPELLDELVDLGVPGAECRQDAGLAPRRPRGTETAGFWDITLPPMRRGAFRWQRLLDAPVIAIPLADPRAYTDRYSEAGQAGHRARQRARGVAGAVLDDRRRRCR